MSVLVPVVIAAGCLLLWAVVHWLTRPRPTAADIDLPAAERNAASVTVGPERGALDRWHRQHEKALLDYLETHDGWVRAGDGQGDSSRVVELEDATVSAAQEHPHPVANAELVALTAAARSSREALRRNDPALATEQHTTYLEYRRRWLERAWQFRTDRDRVLRLQRNEPPSPGAPTTTVDCDPSIPDVSCRDSTDEQPAERTDDDMALRLGDIAPDFQADTTEGPISFHQWKEGSWAVLFSHPKDFTPVCTTELGYTAKLKDDFASRNVKVIGLSVDPVDDHVRWAGDIEETQGQAVNFPMIGDPDRAVATLYDMIHPNANDTLTVRSVFVIDPNNKVRLTITYPASTGRNFDEVLRVIDSLQLTDKHKVATPVNWQQGDDVIIVPALSNEQAAELFPGGWDEKKPYLRVVKQPS
jgi:thioredoxin-dependent peroxiredoxin